jgi:flagellar assembly protein FliH
VSDDALARLAAALEAFAPLERESLAARLRQTVLYLVTRIVGEAGIAPDRLAARIDSAVQLLAEPSESASLRLNPEDLALLQGRVPPRVLTIADAGIERGGFRIETRTTAIEDGPSAWLAQLAAAIERAPMPALD